jgi:hypothetical protein
LKFSGTGAFQISLRGVGVQGLPSRHGGTHPSLLVASAGWFLLRHAELQLIPKLSDLSFQCFDFFRSFHEDGWIGYLNLGDLGFARDRLDFQIAEVFYNSERVLGFPNHDLRFRNVVKASFTFSHRRRQMYLQKAQ